MCLFIGHLATSRESDCSRRNQFRKLQDDLNAELESGADIGPGLFGPSLTFTDRTNVPWKAVVERPLAATRARYVRQSGCHPLSSETPVWPSWLRRR